jgi:hypothetical protein
MLGAHPALFNVATASHLPALSECRQKVYNVTHARDLHTHNRAIQRGFVKARTRRVSRDRSAPSHSEALQVGLQPARDRLYAAYRRLWSRADVGSLVLDFLVLMHQIVRASVPLMKAARAIAVERSRNDRAQRLLARYLVQHIIEERRHDTWLLEDLESAGLPRAAIIERVPSRMAASLVGAQYYWIAHHDPLCLVGYMRVLEGNPPSMAHIDRLQRQSSLPTSAFRTYRLHGELDPNHRQELDLFIDSLPLTQSQADLILESASHTASTLAACIDALEARALARKR